ncbi:MAG: lipopolysaccharide heptosyltransferase II, partial [Omnitrophica bacterium RIFCSPHIGHO2_12_FULL_44_12]
MKIAQILPELNVGGVETGTVDLAKALKKRGDEPYVISNGGSLVEELVKFGIPHLELPVHQKSITSLALINKIASFLERERIDIIHARSRVPAWLAYMAVRRTHCDFVTTCHGYYSKHFFSRVMGWGKRVIVISHSIGRRMIDDFQVPPERITLIHRGVDLEQYKFQSDKYDERPQDRLKIINIGRITPIKGHTEFIRAVHLLSKRFSNFEVWIVGAADQSKEGYFEDLKMIVSRLGMSDKIKFLGARKDVPQLLSQADLLVLSTKIPEAFGRVLIEAGAVGTAVCASRIGGILDVIEDQKNGLLFSPQNMEEMAMSMERLLRNRALSKKYAHALHEKVVQYFNLDQMVTKTQQVYEEVRQQKKILITKLGAMGDLVLAVPSFRMIRQRYPKAHISLLVEPKFVSMMQSNPYLDEIVTFDRRKHRTKWQRLLKVAKRLGKYNYDMSIDLQNNWKTHLISFLARIPKRFGFRRGWLGFLLTHPVVARDDRLPPVQHQYQILRRAGINQFDDTMELWTNPQADEVILERLRKQGYHASKPVVGFVVGASPNWQTKRWPLERFVELADRLIKKANCQIILIGADDDQELSKHFDQLESKNVFNFLGKTSMLELLSLIKRLDVMITGDTAPLHIGNAFGVKLVALFGPTEPKRHMPPGDEHIVLVKRITCQPCYRRV